MSPRVVFVHAHPDDEAIFTGGTMALLTAAGADVTLIIATGGQLGESVSDGRPLAPHREAETRTSCEILGLDPAHDLHFLPYEDSGLDSENPHGFFHQDLSTAARRILACCDGPIDAIVSYDSHGIYGHPDHIAVHQATALASQLHAEKYGSTPTVYESTVDREYLHFVETHVVVDADGGRPVGRGLASTNLGLPTLEIDTAIDVTATIEKKRAAMAAHASQLPADAPLFELGQANFAAVYGWEWYRRVGPAGPLDRLNDPGPSDSAIS